MLQRKGKERNRRKPDPLLLLPSLANSLARSRVSGRTAGYGSVVGQATSQLGTRCRTNAVQPHAFITAAVGPIRRNCCGEFKKVPFCFVVGLVGCYTTIPPKMSALVSSFEITLSAKKEDQRDGSKKNENGDKMIPQDDNKRVTQTKS